MLPPCEYKREVGWTYHSNSGFCQITWVLVIIVIIVVIIISSSNSKGTYLIRQNVKKITSGSTQI